MPLPHGGNLQNGYGCTGLSGKVAVNLFERTPKLADVLSDVLSVSLKEATKNRDALKNKKHTHTFPQISRQ